jgi:photosystem II stability/assembly factor-like uncharacterized protein
VIARRTFGLAAAILVATASWGASWTEINTGLPGVNLGVNFLTIDPSSPSSIYALTFSGSGGPLFVPGLFKTTDGGGSWRAVSSLIGATALAIDPKNSSILYAGANQGVVKSTNGGDSWIDASNGLPNGSVSRLAIDPVTTTTLYAISIGNSVPFVSTGGPVAGLFKSMDGGGSWNVLDTGLAPNALISLIAIDPVTPSTIYVSAPPFGAPTGAGGPPVGVILKSTDGGASWNALGRGLPPPAFISYLAIDPVNPSTLYAVMPSFGSPTPGIFKSTDGGQNWSALSGLPANTSAGNLVIDPTAPSTLYATGSSFKPPGPPSWVLLKTTDGGGHWSTSQIDLPANTSLSSLALDPVTPSRIYAGLVGFPGAFGVPAGPTGGGVLRSTDGGQTWNTASAGLVSFDIRTVAMNPVDASTIYAGGSGGAFKSTDGGANWNGTGLSAYTGSLLADVVNANILYAQTGRPNGCSSSESLLLRSIDGGANWSGDVSPLNSGCILSVTLPFTHVAPMAIDPANPITLYLGESDDQDGYSAVLKSTDGGASWRAIWDWFTGLRGSVKALAIDPARTATLYAGLDGGLFKSTDGGATWSNTLFTGNAVNLLAIDPSNSSTIYVGAAGTASEQGLFKCTVSGMSMRCAEINQGLAFLIGSRLTTATCLIIDRANSNILYLGTSNAGVFRSADGGAHWSPFNDGLTNLQVRALIAAPKGPPTMYAGTAGGVFKILDQ